MTYNDGYEHIDFYDKKEDYNDIAEQFSEGDTKLKDCLLELWSNNIKTAACCKGHDNSSAYISFIIDENSFDLIRATTEYLYLQNGKIELDFINSKKDYNTFIVYMIGEEDKNNYFKFINNYLNNKININISNNKIFTYANYLLHFAKKAGLDCRYTVQKDEMMIGYCFPGVLQIFDNDAKSLDELMSTIETGSIPLTPMFCDENSIERFINVLYPNTFVMQNSSQK